MEKATRAIRADEETVSVPTLIQHLARETRRDVETARRPWTTRTHGASCSTVSTLERTWWVASVGRRVEV